MGNCLRSNKVLAEDQDDALMPKEEEAVNEEKQQAICSTNSSTPSMLESAKEGKKRKVVRFRLHEDEEEKKEENKENINNIISSGYSNSGAVRIKLVLTREELKQVVDFMNGSDQDDHSSSVQQFLSVIKSRGQRVSEAREDLVNGSWRPVLESIAED